MDGDKYFSACGASPWTFDVPGRKFLFDTDWTLCSRRDAAPLHTLRLTVYNFIDVVTDEAS
jgi:hypothetical protein